MKFNTDCVYNIILSTVRISARIVRTLRMKSLTIAGYLHAKVKLENWAFGSDGLLKLLDFGLSTPSRFASLQRPNQICRVNDRKSLC